MRPDNSLTSEQMPDIDTAPIQQYAFGEAECELRRLLNQSRLIGAITEQLMLRAGIKPGMSVLDCGCGVGDVSFITARLVGSGGRVLGIDRSTAGISRARERSAEARLSNVSFEVVDDLSGFGCDTPVDAIVGRLILMYLPDPAATLSHLARQVRDGGLIIFQELCLNMTRFVPSCALADQCVAWIHEALVKAGADVDMGWRLFATFLRAGLPSPEMVLGAPVGAGPDSPMYGHIAETVRSLLPMMELYGIASAEEVMVERLAERLKMEMTAAGTVCATPVLMGAWTRKPEGYP